MSESVDGQRIGVALLLRRWGPWIAAALLGGYVFTWGLIALGLAALFALGMEFHDGERLASMLGLLVFVLVFIRTFAARRLSLVWLTLLGGGGAMTGAAYLIQSVMV